MSRGTPDTAALILNFAYEAFTLFGRLSQNRSAILKVTFAVHYPDRSVEASPRSLATTDGIDVSFSSWGYLDVSVLPVPRI